MSTPARARPRFTTTLLAHGGHTHKVMGTVSSVQGNHLMVKTADGKTAMVMLDAKTKITRGKTKVGSWKRYSYWWTKPTVTTFSDTGLTSGQSVTYRVEVSDGRNVRKSAAATVRVR